MCSCRCTFEFQIFLGSSRIFEVMVARDIFRTQPNIYDGALLQKQKTVDYYCKNVILQMVDWVLNTPATLLKLAPSSSVQNIFMPFSNAHSQKPSLYFLRYCKAKSRKNFQSQFCLLWKYLI